MSDMAIGDRIVVNVPRPQFGDSVIEEVTLVVRRLPDGDYTWVGTDKEGTTYKVLPDRGAWEEEVAL